MSQNTSESQAAPSTEFFHELSLTPDNLRNPEVKNFVTTHDFIPYYWSEITIAGKRLGLVDALFEARYANNNINRPVESQQRAAEETYAKVEGYLDKSESDLSKLRLAFPEGQTEPSPQEIKSNPQIVDAIASFILAFRKVEAEQWPAWNAGVLASALEQIKERLALVPDDEAVALWNMARVNHNQRYKFWSSQLREVEGNKIVHEIKSLRDSRDRAMPPATEYETVTEPAPEPEIAVQEARPANMMPDGSMVIEGSEVEAVTSQPVEVRPRVKKEVATQERLFTVEASDVHVGRTGSKKSRRPYRAKYKDTTDFVTRALKPDEEYQPPSNPDADIDAVFGPPISR